MKETTVKRRKPDLILLLAIIIGLGVLVTGFTQASAHHSGPATQYTAQH